MQKSALTATYLQKPRYRGELRDTNEEDPVKSKLLPIISTILLRGQYRRNGRNGAGLAMATMDIIKSWW